MRAAHSNLRALQSLAHTRDVHTNTSAVFVVLARNLLFWRKDGLDGSEVNVDHAGVGSLLDDPGDDVTLTALELAQHLVVGDVAQTLVDDLLCGEGGDPAEVARGVHRFADEVSVFVVFFDVYGDVAGLAVQLNTRFRQYGIAGLLLGLSRVLEIGGVNGLFDDLHEFLEGNFSLALQETQHAQVDVH